VDAGAARDARPIFRLARCPGLLQRSEFSPGRPSFRRAFDGVAIRPGGRPAVPLAMVVSPTQASRQPEVRSRSIASQ
jgi:hypothetical protein